MTRGRTRRRVLATAATGIALACAAYLVPAVAHAHFLVRLLDPAAAGTPPAAAPASPPADAPTTDTTTSEPRLTTATPGPSLQDMHAWIVPSTCTAEVLDTPSGAWLLTAAHCDTPDALDAAGRTWTVVDRVTPQWKLDPDPATLDLALLQVDGDIEQAVGGGFTVGTAPADGSTVSIWGYPKTTDRLTGCDDLAVTVRSDGAAVESCDLPDGTSGSPWYTADGVVHGVIGGPDDGGTSDWDTESTLFTDETVAWVASVVD